MGMLGAHKKMILKISAVCISLLCYSTTWGVWGVREA